jgi:hypothetical protein
VGDFEKKFPARPILNQKNTCANKLREKYPAPLFGTGIDLTSPRRIQLV